MAKCSICNSRKGKRRCGATAAMVCSLCCGTSRREDRCSGCAWFEPDRRSRNYRSVPYFTTEEMASSLELERIAKVIELALQSFWRMAPQVFDDRLAARLVELLLDRHHFGDRSHGGVEQGLLVSLDFTQHVIDTELSDVAGETLVKVLAAVHRSIGRRAGGPTTYLEFVNNHL